MLRFQQAVILFLSLSLAGLWGWQTGLVSPSPPPIQPQKQYYLEVRGDIPCPGFQAHLSCPSLQEVWETAGGRGLVPNGSQLLAGGSRISLSSDHAVTLGSMAGPDLLTLGLAVDPNHANAADLEAIPGIGPVLAGRIIAFREEQGPFKDIEALQNVKGLGPKILEKIRPYVIIIADSK